MKTCDERYINLKFDGINRHIKTGDKFILPNRRRTTFLRALFGALHPFSGTHFASPPHAVQKQFNTKMKVWFAKFNVIPENSEGIYEEINETQDIITRSLLRSNYDAVHKYDIKQTDERFLVFDPQNEYQFKGIFQPKDWKTSEEIFFLQEFIKIADSIDFTPVYDK